MNPFHDNSGRFSSGGGGGSHPTRAKIESHVKEVVESRTGHSVKELHEEKKYLSQEEEDSGVPSRHWTAVTNKGLYHVVLNKDYKVSEVHEK